MLKATLRIRRGAAGEPVRIAEGFLHFEVIQRFADNELDRFAGGFYRGRELAILSLELRSLPRTISDDDRRVEFVEMPLRAERLFDLIGKFHILAAFGKPDGFQVVHATDQ